MESKYTPISILATEINQVSYDDALSLFRGWIANNVSVKTVVAANVHLVTEASLNSEYAETIADADIVVPDGMPLVWASRLLGGTVRERCYGPTLMEKTIDVFQNSDSTHFFYGSTPEVLEKLQKAVNLRWPDASIVGALSPPFGAINESDEAENIKIINESGAQFVWVGMGCPKQEQWMQVYHQQLNASVVLAVGAAFDFIAGTVSQSPAFLQRAGLEWLYRLCMEPKRLWKRYLFLNPYFVVMFAVQYIRHVLRKMRLDQ